LLIQFTMTQSTDQGERERNRVVDSRRTDIVGTDKPCREVYGLYGSLACTESVRG